MAEEPSESIVGPIVLVSIAAALLGAVLALVALAWLNDGELEYVTLAAVTPMAGANGTPAVDAQLGPFGNIETPRAEGPSMSPDLLAKVDALDVAVGRIRDQVDHLQGTAEASGMEAPLGGVAPTEPITGTTGGMATAMATGVTTPTLVPMGGTAAPSPSARTTGGAPPTARSTSTFPTAAASPPTRRATPTVLPPTTTPPPSGTPTPSVPVATPTLKIGG
jgi:hypothetical protein